MAWYYKNGDTESGPVSKAELQRLIHKKQVNARTLVRSAPTEPWRPLAELARGKAQARPASAPPPPPRPATDPAGPESRPQAGAEVSQAPPAGAAPGTVIGRQAAPQEVQAEEAQPQAPATAVCSQCGRTFPRDQVLTYADQVICAACKPLFVQKLREGASLPTLLEYGGFWIRFLAKFIDNIIMAMVQWAIMIPTSMMFAPVLVQGGRRLPSPGFLAFIGFQIILSILLPAAYSTFFIGRFGATLGKMACRLKVVTPEGGKVSYARACGRFFAEIISYMILAIGYIMAAFDGEKRALHDRICSTRVIRKA
jgi:uncharacterized RDD family membrane protein YckC